MCVTASEQPTEGEGLDSAVSGRSDQGVFAISVASELTGLNPAMMRIYEREGLLTPSRSDGGTRRYSANDIDRLRDIAELMASGMNIVGVREVLRLRDEVRRLTDSREPQADARLASAADAP
jgi:MerR family transcriptional regulator/heat shock protein HspR